VTSIRRASSLLRAMTVSLSLTAMRLPLGPFLTSRIGVPGVKPRSTSLCLRSPPVPLDTRYIVRCSGASGRGVRCAGTCASDRTSSGMAFAAACRGGRMGAGRSHSEDVNEVESSRMSSPPVLCRLQPPEHCMRRLSVLSQLTSRVSGASEHGDRHLRA